MEEYELKDIADNLIIINKATIERLFQEENTDVVVLYMFYYKTAKWQNHNPIKASDEYTKMCLHWGIDRVKNIKKRLKEMELIEVEKRINEKQQIIGWFIRINYLESSGVNSTSVIEPLVAKQHHKILLDNNINTNNNINNNKENINNKLFIQKKIFKKPTLEEIQAYCKERDNEVDAEYFLDYYESKGWMIGKNHMKDWKACVRTWEKKTTKKKDKKKELEEMYKRLAYLDEEE